MTTNTVRTVKALDPASTDISVDRGRVKQISKRKNTEKNNRTVALRQFDEVAELAKKYLPAVLLSALGVIVGQLVMGTFAYPDETIQ